MRIKIWNYRSYPISSPVEIEINEGITFILGVNNVGKSNLLRFFYDFRGLSLNFINNDILKSDFRTSIPVFFDKALTRSSKPEVVKFELADQNRSIIFTVSPVPLNDIHTKELNVKVNHVGYNINDQQGQEFVKKICDVFSSTFYIGSNRNNIQNSNGTSYDIEIGQSFINTWISWADDEEIVKMNKIRDLIVELKELFNYKTFNIRVNKERNNLIISTDYGEFLLTEMGSGIAHFIVVLANVLIKQPQLVLIDEPEQNLHPKMQEIFVRALSSKTKFGLIATSHSVGLARSVADKIYSLTSLNERPKITEFGNHYNPTITQSISEMSYSQFVEIGGNNILLVEGRTDIKSFREIFRKYNIENKFIIIPFGGRQFMASDKSKIIEELNELKRLNANSITAIFDSELTKENDALKKEFEVFIEVCKELGFNVFSTDKHSTENYITQDAINKVIGSTVKALTPYENFNQRNENQKWGKEKNWLMFIEMKVEDFNNTGLGNFIKSKLMPLMQNEIS